MNNNQTNDRALQAGCAGVFASSSYVSIGEPGKPLLYGQKTKDRACYYSKQMITNPGKNGMLPDRYFDKKHTWIADGDKFTDKLSYANTQKEKKKGFGTGDFRRRDEFSNITRTEQYREALGMEDKHRRRAQDTAQPQEDPTIKAKLDKEASDKEARAKDTHLYDLVYEKDNDEKMFAKQQLNSRDTKNPTQLSKERNFGTFQTSSMQYGYAVEEEPHDKPAYARLPIVQSTFYRPNKIPMDAKP